MAPQVRHRHIVRTFRMVLGRSEATRAKVRSAARHREVVTVVQVLAELAVGVTEGASAELAMGAETAAA